MKRVFMSFLLANGQQGELSAKYVDYLSLRKLKISTFFEYVQLRY